MDSLIKETNENLKTILDTMKDNLDSSMNTLENIQLQMDKKVDEAKKYKIQVDVAKDKIRELEDENKSLELSLSELNDKYGKMNLVSIIEAGNREIKTKINDNIKEIKKQKEHIAELTNRARTIKDLLLNLKKDKNIKEQRLENVKIVYGYYSERINEVIDYAFDHTENLGDYKSTVVNVEYDEDLSDDSKSLELENTMVFDEIANIDENKNFKDEMSFINDQIDDTLSDKVSDEKSSKIDEIMQRSLLDVKNDNSNDLLNDDFDNNNDSDLEVDEPLDTTQVFDSIINTDNSSEIESDNEPSEVIENIDNENEMTFGDELGKQDVFDESSLVSNDVPNEQLEGNTDLEVNNGLDINTSLNESVSDNIEESPTIDTNLFNETVKEPNEIDTYSEDKFLDEENENRINKINDLFSSIDDNDKTNLNNVGALNIENVENKIDSAYMDIFGQPLNSDDLNKKEPTMTDIFGNPIKNDELDVNMAVGKKIEELFVENGIDFNRFREDEKSYLKEIYNEEKFTGIIDVLKKNKINLDNIYYAFNIFGEMTSSELENVIGKLVNVGQSCEAIGFILEKLPKVKKYNLDEAIMSYGDHVKDVDMTELIMKAKELYKNGGNN